MHPLHIPSFATAVSSIIVLVESASHIGVVEVLTHPSCDPEMSPQTLHAPVDRHFRLFGHLPMVVPSPWVCPSKNRRTNIKTVTQWVVFSKLY